MTKVKKAQVGIAAKPVATPTLRRGQYKRLGRLEAKNPERAERVANRMIERDTRLERGKRFVADKIAKAKADAATAATAKPAMKKGGKVVKKKK